MTPDGYKKAVQNIAAVVFILYIAVGWKFPAGVTNAPFAKIGVLFVCLVLLVYHPLLGVLAFIAAYKLFASDSDGTSRTFALGDPAYDDVTKNMQKYAGMPTRPRFGWTLEQTVIENMAPVAAKPNGTVYSWKPLVDNLHDAASATDGQGGPLAP